MASTTRHDTSEDSHDNIKYRLPRLTEFGFHEICSEQVRITNNSMKAEKRDPTLHYAHGVAYGARALRGNSEFEVQLTNYGTGWSGTFKLGIAKFTVGQSIQVNKIPRYSPEGNNHCVWSSDKIHNRLGPNPTAQEKEYGRKNLDELRENDRLGFRLSVDGTLYFFVNDKCQGVAAKNVYEKGSEIYPVVDHYANCKSTVITRAVILGQHDEEMWGGGENVCCEEPQLIPIYGAKVVRVDINLQELCLQRISSFLTSTQQASSLPLPNRLILELNKLIQD